MRGRQTGLVASQVDIYPWEGSDGFRAEGSAE